LRQMSMIFLPTAQNPTGSKFIPVEVSTENIVIKRKYLC